MNKNKTPYINVGELKNLIKDIPDDYDVCLTDEYLDIHIAKVNSIGILQCEEEDHKALCFYSSRDLNNHGIDKELPDFIEEVLF
jgi:hypothetical protein